MPELRQANIISISMAVLSPRSQVVCQEKIYRTLVGPPATESAEGSNSDLGPRPSLIRPSLNNGHMGAAASCPFGADSVEKVYLSHRSQIVRAVGAAIEY